MELADLRGDCHAHSDWSDGVHTVEAMAEAARARGYGYLVLTDHSHGLAIARGLTPERVAAQRLVIAEINARFAREEEEGTAPPVTPPGGFRLLHGCELEIRGDGSLDFDDEVLASFDLVVASLHQGRRQPRAQLTARVLGAIRSPHVDVIAHPAGRMLGERSRDDLDLAWDEIFAAAAATGTLLEIDGSDHRLDLSPERARLAVAAGCTLAIDSDAHRTDELAGIAWGVAQARRAWVEPAVGGQHVAPRPAARVGGRQAGARSMKLRAPRLHNPLRRGAPSLGAGAPGHPLPPAPRRATRPPAPDASLQGAPGRSVVSVAAAGRPARVSAVDPVWEMVALAVALAAIGRLANGPALWAAAALAGLALAFAALEVLGAAELPAGADDLGIPVESFLVSGVTGFATVTAIHLVPVGLLLVPALVAVGALTAAVLEIERRILGRPAGPTTADRTALVSNVMVVAGIAFSGIGAAIPGALVEPPPIGLDAPVAGLPLEGLALLAALDGLVAGILGYRLAALRSPTVRGALAAALSYAAVVAIAAAALRAMGLPRLLGPALLTLVLYLWSAYRGVPRNARRDARWIWEILLLRGARGPRDRLEPARPGLRDGSAGDAAAGRPRRRLTGCAPGCTNGSRAPSSES